MLLNNAQCLPWLIKNLLSNAVAMPKNNICRGSLPFTSFSLRGDISDHFLFFARRYF